MFLMSSLENCILVKKMDIDREHIDHFVLETDEGTKRMKDKFHRMASEQRNSYIENQKSIYHEALREIRNEISRRFPNEMPVDKSEEYTRELLEVDRLFNLVVMNADISNSFKLKIDYIIASITDETSLEELNDVLSKFIQKFQEVGISLVLDDFKYTMFTEKYMDSYFQKADFSLLKDTFEKIYFTCPDIKMQLKMNLVYIIQKYDKEFDKRVLALKDSLFEKAHVSSLDVIEKYVQARYEIGNKMAMDEYSNTKLFLDGKKKITDYIENASARVKNYDLFAEGVYSSLSDEQKERYNSAVMSLYVTLNELKKYYHYEFILKDLLERYKSKDSVRNTYLAKKKEIEKEEKVRLSIYKEYLKANGIGFLAKKNDIKMKNAMLKMNDQIRKLRSLYDELEDLEISNVLVDLNESSSIYDLFLASLKSFPFLEKCFSTNEFFSSKTLEENIEDFFRFLYNPNNHFLRKINVFTDYNITEIVANKYRLFDLIVTEDMINLDNIDITMESVQFINLIQNIERSHISLSKIQTLCQFQDIISTNDVE